MVSRLARAIFPVPLRLLSLPALAAAALASGRPPAGVPPEVIDPPPPPPALLATAARHRIPTEGFDGFDPAGPLHDGDSVTGLLAAYGGPEVEEWIAQLTIIPPDEDELSHQANATLYAATGAKFRFTSGLVGLRIVIFGPVSEGDAERRILEVRSARTAVHSGYLRFGAEGLCRTILKFAARPGDLTRDPSFSFASSPYRQEEVKEARRRAAGDGVTRRDQEEMARGLEAINEFCSAAQSIPGIMSVARRGIDWPSFWTMLEHMDFGIWTVLDWKGTTQGEQAIGGRPIPAYCLPFSLHMFGSHVADGGWLVSAPRPPLLATGGFIGIWLRSVEHPGRWMMVRVIAARAGQVAPAADR